MIYNRKFDQLSLYKLELRGCTTCMNIKPLSEFYTNKSRKDGYCNQCKSCSKELSSKWTKNNPEKNAERGKKWAKNNPEKAKESCNNSRRKNQRHYTLKKYEYNKLNKEKRREIRKKQARKQTRKLTDGYLKSVIKKQFDIERTEMPPELIELKRTEIQLKRTKKQLLNQIKNNENDEQKRNT